MGSEDSKTARDRMRTITLYFATALAETVGCYLSWLSLKQNGSAWLLIPAAVNLTLLRSICFLWNSTD